MKREEEPPKKNPKAIPFIDMTAGKRIPAKQFKKLMEDGNGTKT